MVVEPGGLKTTRLCLRVNKVTVRNKKGTVKSILFPRYAGGMMLDALQLAVLLREPKIGGLHATDTKWIISTIVLLVSFLWVSDGKSSS